jgi:arsenical pump membrane protein
VGGQLLVEHNPELLSMIFGSGSSLSASWCASPGSAGLANVTNNLPAYLVVEPFAHSSARLVTTLVAVDVGPMLLAWGSLANLLWLRACRTRGLSISMVALRPRGTARRSTGRRRCSAGGLAHLG